MRLRPCSSTAPAAPIRSLATVVARTRTRTRTRTPWAFEYEYEYELRVRRRPGLRAVGSDAGERRRCQGERVHLRPCSSTAPAAPIRSLATVVARTRTRTRTPWAFEYEYELRARVRVRRRPRFR
ncbi:MAG: hypothetical protein HZA54_16520 [Planctomycetes bacterium]|nr:hypothetical protein [Planctomycetota bacterium]